MKGKLICSIFVLFALSMVCKAQTYTGCIVQNSTTYPATNLYMDESTFPGSCGGANYQGGGAMIDVSRIGPACRWVAITSTEPCSVERFYCGLKATYVYSCSLPLDTLSLICVFIAAGYGYYVIRKTYLTPQNLQV